LSYGVLEETIFVTIEARILMLSKFMTSLLIVPLVGWSTAVFAQEVRLQTQIVSAAGVSSQLTLHFVDGQAESEAFLQNQTDTFINSNTQVLFSEVGEAVLAPHFKLQHKPNESVAVTLTGANVAFINFAKNPEKRVIGKKERIQSVIFATIQTGIVATSYYYISATPLEPAVAATIVAGFLNFYFNWDVERWNNFLYRWRDKAIHFAESSGFKKTAKSEAYKESMKAITGYIGALSFGAIFTGIALSDNLLNELQLDNMGVIARIFTTVSTAFLISYPFDATFGRWLKNGHPHFKREEVQLLARFKSLIMTAITPLILVEYQPAYSIGAVLFGLGITITLYEFGDKIGKTFELSTKKVMQFFKTFWTEKIQQPLCQLLLIGDS